MPASSPDFELTLRDRLREHWARRGMGLVVALLLEAVLLLLLFTLSISREEEAAPVALTTFDASDSSEASSPEQSEAELQDEVAPEPDPQPAPESPSPVLPSAMPPSALPRPSQVVTPPPAPRVEPQPVPEPAPSTPPRPRAVIRSDRNYGPVDTGRPGPPDSQVVGTAPDGSPLYAAAWYREPYHEELAGYLSTARGPGWGLINCRTVADWRVEDCRIERESPPGSGIARAAQAAAWQFLVRPPRVDGQYKVGAWVQIRITYSVLPR